jgi:hypothetical protein
MNIIIKPSPVDVLNFISQLLIANARRGLTPAVSVLPIQAIAEVVVNNEGIIPLITQDTPTTNG